MQKYKLRLEQQAPIPNTVPLLRQTAQTTNGQQSQQLIMPLSTNGVLPRSHHFARSKNGKRKDNVEYRNMLAVRRGFADHNAYLDFLAQRKNFANFSAYRIFLLQKRKFRNFSEYYTHLARRHNFNNLSEQREHRAKKNNFKNYKEYSLHLLKKRGFESHKDYMNRKQGLISEIIIPLLLDGSSITSHQLAQRIKRKAGLSFRPTYILNRIVNVDMSEEHKQWRHLSFVIDSKSRISLWRNLHSPSKI